MEARVGSDEERYIGYRNLGISEACRVNFRAIFGASAVEDPGKIGAHT
jgi:hypothetical protein